MRRSYATAVAALGLTVSVLAAAPATGEPTGPSDGPAGAPAPASAAAEEAAEQAAEQAVATAAAVLAGDPPAAGAETSPTLALRDVFAVLPELDPADRKQALGLLARPSQGATDPYGDGYTVPSRKECVRRICVHWVTRTADAPPDRAWVTRTMKVMGLTWAREVGDLGYRAPLPDGVRGGNDKFDVYLKDIGGQGLYGYCVPERELRGWQWRASGYCVLDDDFARSQFGADPVDSLRVTAAHEFFHAIQFNYDYAEDPWLMEGSATWMEERVADAVNDNRQYLRYGQVRRPHQPLDRYVDGGSAQYGNWAFFEYLSTRFGLGVVRSTWEIAADRSDSSKDPYSTLAVRRALPQATTFAKVFRSYTAANTAPALTYPEGESWPRAAITRSHSLTSSVPLAEGSVRVDHLASRNISVTPGESLGPAGWQLRVVVDGPAAPNSPTAFLLVHRRDGSLARVPVGLDADGNGQAEVPFSAASVSRATLTLANASARFDCWLQETYSCQGQPLDDNRLYGYQLRAFQS